MKKYVRPQIESIELRAEESIALQPGCAIGECHYPNGEPRYTAPGS